MKTTILTAMAAAAALAAANPSAAATYLGSGALLKDFTTTTSTIAVADAFEVQNVTLSLNNIYHSYASDVELFLEHGGVVVQLLNHESTPHSYMSGDLGFDDASGQSVATYNGGGGVWRPYEALTQFVGVSSAGAWTLRAFDSVGGDAGSYATWTLNLASANPPGGGAVPEPASWALMVAGFGALGARLRIRRRGLSLAA